MHRASGETQNADASRPPRLLVEAGIPFALQSGYESYVPKTRVVLFEAAVAAAQRAALRARAGADHDRRGAHPRRRRAASAALEVGKDGDLALYDGDPFEYTTHCVGTIIEGRVTSDAVR